MTQFEVQGIVSAQTGEPLVQCRQLDDDGNEEARFQFEIIEVREVAQNLVEAAANAVYDAALIAWAKERGDEDMGVALVRMIRDYRADKWGLPDRPKDWRTKSG